MLMEDGDSKPAIFQVWFWADSISRWVCVTPRRSQAVASGVIELTPNDALILQAVIAGGVTLEDALLDLES